MRLFTAIHVPDYVKQNADMVRDKLLELSPPIKWVEYENYHLTLKFLGEVEKAKLSRIEEKLFQAGQEAEPFQLALSAPGCFSNRKRPRVLYLGVSGQIDKAMGLGRFVDSHLLELGFEPDKRRRFHLTLGRFRSDGDNRELFAVLDSLQEDIDQRKFTVNEFFLMESKLSKKGPAYSALKAIKLG